MIEHHISNLSTCKILSLNPFLLRQPIFDWHHTCNISPRLNYQPLVPPSRLQTHQWLDQTVLLRHIKTLNHQLDHLLLRTCRQIGSIKYQDRVVLRHHVQHALHGVVDYLFDVVPLVHLAFYDGPEGFEVFETRDHVVADDEVVQVGVDAVAVGYD